METNNNQPTRRTFTFEITEDCTGCMECLNVKPDTLVKGEGKKVVWIGSDSRIINVGSSAYDRYTDFIREANKVCPFECFREM